MIGHVIFPKKRFYKETHDVKYSRPHLATIIPRYIPPGKDYAPNVFINKNGKYLLVRIAIQKGVHVMSNIMSNMKKQTLMDHDSWKFPELQMLQYMTSVQLVELRPIHLVPME